jgi:hypothetical protein
LTFAAKKGVNPMWRKTFLVTCVGGYLVVAGLLGCAKKGPQQYKVFGTVTFKGAPLSDGVIMFTPESGSSGTSASIPIKNGKYESPPGGGLAPGKYKVMISAAAGGSEPKNPDEPPGVSELRKELIPEKYNVRSDIIREVQANNNNQFDFDIK